MKKNIFQTVIIFSLLLLCSFTMYELSKIKEPKKTKTELKLKTEQIPFFNFNTLEGELFSINNLQKGKPLIIIYFSPECGLCAKSGKLFYKFRKLYKNCQVLFVSSDSNKKIISYIKKYNLNKISNITFLTTSERRFFETFKESSTPSYFFYNSKGKHIKTINDNVPAKIILRYIKITSTI